MTLARALANLRAPLHRYLLATGAPASLAEELVQETISQALASEADFRGDAKLFTWLCAIARHKAADHFRRDRRQREVVSLDGGLREKLALYSREPLPEEVIQHRETGGLVRQCLCELDDNYALALQLKYVEGWSVKKIAEALGRSRTATQSLLSRARKQFRSIFLSSLKEGGRQDGS